MRISRIGLTGVVMAAMIAGCGGGDDEPIEKSAYTPTPEQMKAMQEEAMKNTKVKLPAKKR